MTYWHMPVLSDMVDGIQLVTPLKAGKEPVVVEMGLDAPFFNMLFQRFRNF
jgi:hypothetical protein